MFIFGSTCCPSNSFPLVLSPAEAEKHWRVSPAWESPQDQTNHCTLDLLFSGVNHKALSLWHWVSFPVILFTPPRVEVSLEPPKRLFFLTTGWPAYSPSWEHRARSDDLWAFLTPDFMCLLMEPGWGFYIWQIFTGCQTALLVVWLKSVVANKSHKWQRQF